MEDVPGRSRPRPGVPQVHRVLSLPERLPRAARPRAEREIRRPALFRSRRGSRDASFGWSLADRVLEGHARPRLLQHHQVLHGGLSRRNPHHGQRHHPVEGARGRRLLRPDPVADPKNQWEAEMSYALKTISREGIPQALAKAERYRLLNEPGEAESICRDVLAVEPDNQDGLRMLGLAITDQFAGSAADRHAEAE